jgi:EmrB/QacA subfamily drug resistance transporter
VTVHDTGADPRRGSHAVALGVLCTVLFLTFLDNTVVSVALGNVQSELHAGVTSLQWVVNGYALTFASVMLAAGMIGDEFGRKTVLMSGVGVFCAGSLLCALAPSSGWLIAGRIVMGLGAAGSEPGTLSVIRHLYPEGRERARAVGVWAAVSGVALAAGPVIGGALVGLGSWRAVFWFNLALGVAILFAAGVVLPESADPDAHRVDTAGALLGAAALGSFSYAVIYGENNGYGSVVAALLFAASLLAGLAFLWRESRAAHPLLDLTFLRRAAFTTANATAFVAYFGTFALFFFTALYLNVVSGFSGFHIALIFLPMAVGMILAAIYAGRWTAVSGPRWGIGAGCLLFAAGLLVVDASLSDSPGYFPLSLGLAVAGIGIGTVVVPVTTTALDAVPARRSGMAASATNTSREVGAVVGVAVLGSLVNGQLTAHLSGALHRLGVPVNFDAIIIGAVEGGGLPTSGHTQGAGGSAGAGNRKLVQEVIQAAYAAFRDGLHAALVLSAVLVLLAGAAAVVLLRRGPAGR